MLTDCLHQEWGNTANTRQRQILDLRSIGMRQALSLGRFHHNRASEGLSERCHENWMVLIFVLAGSQHYRVEGEEMEVSGGWGLRILPGQSYSSGGRPEQRGDLAWLILKTQPLPRGRALGMGAAGAQLVFSRLLDPDAAAGFRLTDGVPRMIAAAFEAWEKRADPLRGEVIRNQIAALTLAAAGAVGECPKADVLMSANAQRIDKVLDWVGTRLGDQITAGSMAEVSGLSEARFFTEFKKCMGTSPKDYLLRLRIGRAADLLRSDPALSVTTLAHELGFSSSQYFSTVFRRYMGTSPRDWRQNLDEARDLS